MIRKKFLKVATTIMATMIAFSVVGCSNLNSSKTGALNSSNVTLITEVTPGGEVGYAVACDFGSNVDASKISKTSFEVQSTAGDKAAARTVTKVYTNDTASTATTSKSGRYVIIELNPSDKNASTLTFTRDTFLNARDQIKYAVTQKVDITTSDNTTFKASTSKISAGKLVTPVVDDFKKLTYKDSSGNEMNYRLFEPKTQSEKKYPLVLFLHGSGERGSDNTLQLVGNQGATVWATPEVQAKNPCYVLAPQASVGKVLNAYWVAEPNYDMVVSLVKETIKKYSIDPSCVYVEGMSNGGVGTFNILKKNPDLFAAAIPICGASNMSASEATKAFVPPLYYPVDSADVQVLKNIPIWAFAAADDPLVDSKNSREITAAIKAAGGNLINYTEYPAGTIKPNAHASWIPALQNKDLINWLFNQKK